MCPDGNQRQVKGFLVVIKNLIIEVLIFGSSFNMHDKDSIKTLDSDGTEGSRRPASEHRAPECFLHRFRPIDPNPKTLTRRHVSDHVSRHVSCHLS